MLRVNSTGLPALVNGGAVGGLAKLLYGLLFSFSKILLVDLSRLLSMIIDCWPLLTMELRRTLSKASSNSVRRVLSFVS